MLFSLLWLLLPLPLIVVANAVIGVGVVVVVVVVILVVLVVVVVVVVWLLGVDRLLFFVVCRFLWKSVLVLVSVLVFLLCVG